MANPSTLQERWSRGMRRDVPRDDMPENAAWNLVDWIPDHGGARLRKRGGTTHGSPALTDDIAGLDYALGGIVAPFAAGTKNLVVARDVGTATRLLSIESDSAATAITTTGGPFSAIWQNPVFHRDRIIIVNGAGASAPFTYTGSGNVTALGGSPPNALYATVHKDRTVMAYTTANPNRVWFSDAGDPTTWDVTNVFLDTTFVIRGIASIKNAILIFSEGATERIIGSTPPPQTDFEFGFAFAEGTPDARSIAYWGDNVVFANPSGIFITDGSALDDLTKASGMLQYWQELLSTYSITTDPATGWSLVAGVHQGYYVISVTNAGVFVDAAMIDLQRRTWLRLSNLKAFGMWRQESPDELFIARSDTARVSRFAPVFIPAAANKSDADATPVLPVYESPFFASKGKQLSWKRLYIDRDLRDAASDDPLFRVSYIESPEDTSYTLLGDILAETSAQEPARVFLGHSNYGMAFKITQSASSSDTRLARLRAEVHEREGSRIG